MKALYLYRTASAFLAAISFLLVSGCFAVVQTSCTNVIVTIALPDFDTYNISVTAYNSSAELVGSGELLVEEGMGYLSFPITPQPTGTEITIYFDGDAMWSQPCEGAPITFYNPGDARIDPRPGDRVIAYCNPNGVIDVWGIKDDSTGYSLTTFNYADIVAAGPTGLTTFLGGPESVSISVDDQDNFWLAWNGGPYGNFAKGFSCDYEPVAQ